LLLGIPASIISMAAGQYSGKADFLQYASIVLFLTGMAYTHLYVCGEIPPAKVVFKSVPQPIFDDG